MNADTTLHRSAFRAMGSDNELLLAGGDHPDVVAQAAIDDVLRIERKYSRFRDDSVTTAINRSGGGAAVAIDGETAALLGYAHTCFEQSGGRFDLTAGVLRTAWDFARRPPVRPDVATLRAALARVGWSSIEWNARAIRLPRRDMEIDFGGIGKEYAADRVATIAQQGGAQHGCVNLGGDVRAWGGRPDGAAWRVGVRHPRAPAAAVAGVDLHDGAVATSGDYARYVDIDGRRYCHIIDAVTGEPVTAWRSITVVAPLAIVAGSYATIAMLMQRDAVPFLDRAALQWLGVDADGELHGTLHERGAEKSTESLPLPRKGKRD
ncbi:MAG: FAD:protein FMN transferase [Betaproteobacteria bacterium]